MRYRSISEVMATDMPNSLQAWLGHQLDSRGIDATIYSRYILSILQQGIYDPGDILDHPPSLIRPRKSVNSVSSVANVTAYQDKMKQKLKKSEKRKSAELSLDEMKKMAAIECLLAVTDETAGIETLVEELISRIKEVNSSENRRINQSKVFHEIHRQRKKSNSLSNDDPAEKYYAAFPSLSGKCEELKPKLKKKPESKIWAEVASKEMRDIYTYTEKESSARAYNRNKRGTFNLGSRKHVKSPPKEEKDRKNLESRRRSKRENYESESELGGTNYKTYSHTSPNSKYHKRSRNIHTKQHKMRSDHSRWDTKHRHKQREFYQPYPEFVVPKVPPKKCVVQYSGYIEDRYDLGRSKSEEKFPSKPVPLHRSCSDILPEENRSNRYPLRDLISTVEDLMWYSKPLDDWMKNLVEASPVQKHRLYERFASNTPDAHTDSGLQDPVKESIPANPNQNWYKIFQEGNENLAEYFTCNESEIPESFNDHYHSVLQENVKNYNNYGEELEPHSNCSPMEEFEFPVFIPRRQEFEENANHNFEYSPAEYNEEYNVFRHGANSHMHHFYRAQLEEYNVDHADVPPNTPVHLQDQIWQEESALGLEGLIELAEQMKSLSQDSEPPGLTPLFIVEPDKGEESSDTGIDIDQNTSEMDSPHFDNVPFFKTVNNEEVDCGIPTPLSSCSPVLNWNESNVCEEEIFVTETEVDPYVATASSEKEDNENDLVKVQEYSVKLGHEQAMANLRLTPASANDTRLANLFHLLSIDKEYFRHEWFSRPESQVVMVATNHGSDEPLKSPSNGLDQWEIQQYINNTRENDATGNDPLYKNMNNPNIFNASNKHNDLEFSHQEEDLWTTALSRSPTPAKTNAHKYCVTSSPCSSLQRSTPFFPPSTNYNYKSHTWNINWQQLSTFPSPNYDFNSHRKSPLVNLHFTATSGLLGYEDNRKWNVKAPVFFGEPESFIEDSVKPAFSTESIDLELSDRNSGIVPSINSAFKMVTKSRTNMNRSINGAVDVSASKPVEDANSLVTEKEIMKAEVSPNRVKITQIDEDFKMGQSILADLEILDAQEIKKAEVLNIYTGFRPIQSPLQPTQHTHSDSLSQNDSLVPVTYVSKDKIEPSSFLEQRTQQAQDKWSQTSPFGIKRVKGLVKLCDKKKGTLQELCINSGTLLHNYCGDVLYTLSKPSENPRDAFSIHHTGELQVSEQGLYMRLENLAEEMVSGVLSDEEVIQEKEQLEPVAVEIITFNEDLEDVDVNLSTDSIPNLKPGVFRSSELEKELLGKNGQQSEPAEIINNQVKNFINKVASNR